MQLQTFGNQNEVGALEHLNTTGAKFAVFSRILEGEADARSYIANVFLSKREHRPHVEFILKQAPDLEFEGAGKIKAADSVPESHPVPEWGSSSCDVGLGRDRPRDLGLRAQLLEELTELLKSAGTNNS